MSDLFGLELLRIGSFTLTLGSLFYALFILVLAKFMEVFLFRLFVRTYVKKREIDPGRSFAVARIIKYVIYFIATLVILKNFGYQLSAILLGSAGLLVGLGLGLQHTFADLLAGFILLIEGNIAVGDIVVIDGMVGVVKNIKLRTTEIKTRDLVFIIVPNSKLVSNNVTNWSHNDSPARFHIEVSVSYKEDIEKVEKILLESAASLPDIVQIPKPHVQLTELSDYSIKLKLFFYSDELFFMEKVLSDLRKKVLIDLRNAGIEIPYPLKEIKVINPPAV
ncbi:MAG: mechanosensitive ion channel [Saprospiraceae bacterium]|nr:mechanosensitive ion channel [Saprospiraceae bacterium]